MPGISRCITLNAVARVHDRNHNNPSICIGQRRRQEACNTIIMQSHDALWDHVCPDPFARHPDGETSLWATTIIQRFDEASKRFEAAQTTAAADNEATIVAVSEVDNSDFFAIVDTIAHGWMEPSPTPGQMRALGRLLNARAIRSMRDWLRSDMGPVQAQWAQLSDTVQASSLESQYGLLKFMGQYARAKGASYLPVREVGATVYIPSTPTLRSVGFQFLVKNASKDLRAETMLTLGTLGLNSESVMTRNDYLALEFWVSAHLTNRAISGWAKSAPPEGVTIQKIGPHHDRWDTDSVYRVTIAIPGRRGSPVSLKITPLGGDGMSSGDGGPLDKKHLLKFASLMLSPGQYTVFMELYGTEIEQFHLAAVGKHLDRAPRFGRYMAWIVRTAQGSCAKCLRPLWHVDGDGMPFVDQSDLDHVCREDKTSATSASSLFALHPLKNPDAIREVFALRAVHSSSSCHDRGGHRNAR